MDRYHHPVVPTVRSFFALSALALASLAPTVLTAPVYAQTPTSNVYAFTDLNSTASSVLGTNVSSFAYGISGGVTVGSGGGSNAGGSNALRWNADGTVTNLHSQIAGSGINLGINAASAATGISGGVIVGAGQGSSTGNNGYALRWNADGTVTNLHSRIASNGINLGTNASSTAAGTSGGVTVGYGSGSNTGSNGYALRWNADGTVANLNTLANLGNNAGSTASAISGGVTVGYGFGSNTGDNFNALRWDADGTVTNLNTLANLGNNATSLAYGISGGVTVGYGRGTNTGNGESAFRWNADGTALNLQQFVPGRAGISRANAIDASTGIIVGTTSNNNAALWTPLNAGSGGANSLTVRNGVTTTINRNFTQSSGFTTVNGTLSLSGATLTIAGGTLNGAGTIAGNVLVTGSGILAPGNSPGTLTVSTGNFAMNGGTYSVDLAGLGAGQYDVLNVSGGSAGFTGGAFVLNYLSGYAPVIGDSFNVVTTTGGLSGANTVAVPSGWAFTASGNNGRLSYLGAAVVPEASAGLLVSVAGVLALGVAATRRKHSAAA